jgi:hypothetical protein
MTPGNFQSPGERAAISAVIVETIGRQLRQVYDSDGEQPLAHDLADCLVRLEGTETGADDADEDHPKTVC